MNPASGWTLAVILTGRAGHQAVLNAGASLLIGLVACAGGWGPSPPR